MSRNRIPFSPSGRLVFSLMLLSVALASGGPTQLRPAQQRSLDFNRDIRPIFSENCFACHGPDKNKRKAGLRLDRREDATAKLESGECAVVPGDVGQSRLLKVIVSEDDDERMP